MSDGELFSVLNDTLESFVREMLIKAFPPPDLHHEVIISTADPFDPPKASKGSTEIISASLEQYF